MKSYTFLCLLVVWISFFMRFTSTIVIFYSYFFNYYLFIFGCVGSSLLHAGFLQLRRVGATLHCSGFSCHGAQDLGARASVAVARGLSSCGSQALERRLRTCGAWASLLRGMWDLPGPGLEPVSPALAGRFLTTAPPGRSNYCYFEFFSISK